jgi:hypothetical protein
MLYLTAKELVKLIFVGFEEKLPGFHHLPVKYSIIHLIIDAKYCPSLDNTVRNIRYNYLKADLFHNLFFS